MIFHDLFLVWLSKKGCLELKRPAGLEGRLICIVVELGGFILIMCMDKGLGYLSDGSLGPIFESFSAKGWVEGNVNP